MGAHDIIQDSVLRQRIRQSIGLFLCLFFLLVIFGGRVASSEEPATPSEPVSTESIPVGESGDTIFDEAPTTPAEPVSKESRPAEERSTPPSMPPQAPPEPIQIKSAVVEGNTVIQTKRILQALAPLLPYTVQGPGLTGLETFTDAITHLYRKDGYFLAQAYIPEQEIQNGALKITVVEGSLGAVAISGNEVYPSSFVENHFHKGAVAAYPAFERGMLLLNGYDDLSASGILQVGAAPGSSDLAVQVKDENPVHYTLDYNNFGSNLVSRHRFGVGLTMGNLLQYGSRLSVHGVAGAPVSDMLYERVDYGIPIRFNGTRLNFMYAEGDSDIGKSLADLNISMETTGWGVSVEHPFIMRRFLRLTGTVGFEGQDFKQSFGSVSLTRMDRIRLLHLDASYNKQTEGGHQNSARVSLRQGLGAIFGAMEDNDPAGSRAGADNRFFKGVLEIARVQRMTDAISLAVRGTNQFSPDSLVVGEQFALGGPDSVRGYAVGEFLSDNGYTVSLEMRMALLEDKNLLQAVFFVDQGEGSIEKPSPGEVRKGSFTGAGFGVRAHHAHPMKNNGDKAYPLGMDIMANVGYPLEDGPTIKVGAAYYVRAVLRY